MAQKATAKPYSLEFYLDDSPVSKDIKTWGFYEQFETGIVRQWVKRGYTAVDIGAHIGYYSLILSRLVENIGRVFAFEPSPDSFKLLQKNVVLNRGTNVFLEQRAVLDRTGKTRLYFNTDNTADNRIARIDKAESTVIDCIKLDDYFRRYDSKIGFVKMDIQGAEFRALRGMINILDEYENIKLLLEFWPHGLRQNGDDPADLLTFLLDRKFRVSFVIRHKWKIEEITSPDSFLDSYSKHPGAFTNLLCKRH